MVTTYREPTLADLAAVLGVVADAFVEEPAVVDLVRDLAAGGAFESGVALLAEEDGRAVGFVLVTPATLDGTDCRLASLAPLAVAPDAQNRGIGSSLVKRALDRARAADFDAVVVLGHPGYYPRFGFEPAFPRGLKPSNPVPAEHAAAWMVTESAPGSLEGIAGRVAMMPPLDDPKYW